MNARPRRSALALPLLIAYGCGDGASFTSEEDCPGSGVSVIGIAEAQAGRLVRSSGVEETVEDFDFVLLQMDESVSINELVIEVEMDYENEAEAAQSNAESTASCAPSLQSADNLDAITVLADKGLGGDRPPGTSLEDVLNIVPRFVFPGVDPSAGGFGPESGIPVTAFLEDAPPVPLAFVLDFVGGDVEQPGPYTFSISVALENGSAFVSEVAVPTLSRFD